RGAPLTGRTDLFVVPGFEFRRTEALLTNFHLPRSTLLALVMAFAGVEETRRLYRLAIEERYRFYSFGDAMLVLGRLGGLGPRRWARWLTSCPRRRRGCARGASSSGRARIRRSGWRRRSSAARRISCGRTGGR